ncbi:hypothetical protein RDWZM_008789 [Blomia tropicalis]|uniref:Uncharacterized protein n=1 Tax=Blomia tropicalis TaxID=40697 RepID=A0A9Q0M4A0_BLOTA|nr:hypothetical protein RDWZM_008789 [Blomia tropicalis]
MVKSTTFLTGILKSQNKMATGMHSEISQQKRGIKFAEDSPQIIGYRDPSDDEEEESFLASKSKIERTSSSHDADFDEENDPERIKLRTITESNTLFNSNYQNFKINDQGIGLGRTKGTNNSASPIKFVIQDGYKQPLPQPIKFKNRPNTENGTNMKVKMFETNSTFTKPTPSQRTTKASYLPSRNELSKDSSNQDSSIKLMNKKTSPPPPIKSNLKNVTELKPSKQSVQQTKDPLKIPNITIPRVKIPVDKIQRSPPPKSKADSSEKDLEPNKVDVNVVVPEVKPTHHRNSVTLLGTEGSILPLDSEKVPIELKEEDIVDREQLYLATTKEAKNNSTKEDELDGMSDSGSDSGASGCTPLNHNCSPPSTSPIPQLSHSASSSSSCSPSPDSLDFSPDSYEPTKSISSISDESDASSPIPPPDGPPPPLPDLSDLNKPPETDEKYLQSNKSVITIEPQNSIVASASEQPYSEPSVQIAKTNSQNDEVQTSDSNVDSRQIVQSSSMFNQPSHNNKTMISISYRRSSSQSSENSNDGSKRNQMLQKLALDLKEHRSESGSNLSSNSLVSSSSSSSISSNAIVNPPEHNKSVKIGSENDTFCLEDCLADENETDYKTSKSIFKSNNDNLSEDDDSECEPLPDMIKDDDELSDTYSDLSDSEMEHPHAHLRTSDNTISKETSSKSSNSSLGSKKADKTVSNLFKNVVHNSNTKKYTQMMKSNFTKTSKFFRNATKQIGNETQDIVMKLKNNNESKSKESTFYYPETYSSDSGSKSKFAFSPNEPSEQHKEKKVKKKFEVFSKTKNAFKNFEGKFKSSSNTKVPAQAELPFDPLGGSFENVNCSDSGPALLKIKRLNSSIDPNITNENNLQNDYNYSKPPPLPPRNYDKDLSSSSLKSSNDHINCSLKNSVNDNVVKDPPQAPVRHKKLAKKRSQIVDELLVSSTPSTDSESNIVIDNSESTTPTISQLQLDYENYLNDGSQIKRIKKTINSVSIIENIQNARYFKVQKVKSDLDTVFNLMCSKTIYATCYDHELINDADIKFQGESFRLVPSVWSRFFDITTFCEQFLYNPETQSQLFPTSESRRFLVNSLVLQLHTVLAKFERGTFYSKNPISDRRTIGDVNETLVAISEDHSEENVTNDDYVDESLSMMQSFCLQVFLIRLTSMITNEDNDKMHGNGNMRRTNSHYRNLVRRNQNGFSSVCDLFLLCATDIFDMLKDRNNLKNSPKMIEDQINEWFNQAGSCEQIVQFYTPTGFKPSTILAYLRIAFTNNEYNRNATIKTVKNELCDRS